MSSSSDKSYFGKTMLFLVLSIVIFLIFKNVLPSRLFPEKVVANENILMDSMALIAQSDTIDLETALDTLNVDTLKIVTSDSTRVGTKDSIQITMNVDANFDPSLSAEGYQNLQRFYAKLEALENDKSRKVRIGYFGDSMNDGDFIVQDVRSLFQDTYGGQGVGFVSITSLSAGARGSVSHQYSKKWQTQSFVKVKKPLAPFGIDGQVFFANDTVDSHWVKYRAQGQRHSTMLNRPTLFYGHSSNNGGYISVKAGKDSVYTKELNPTRLLNTLTVTTQSVRSLQVDFQEADSIPIYGFNFDNGVGVHVDNFSIRGNSGLPLSILNPSLMNAFDNIFNYDLIVLHYGANVLGYGSTNYGWYDKNMTTVVNNLRKCFPNADFLIISTADKATKIDGEMQTDPAVLPLAKAQKSYARKTNSGYINLYSLMGGEGSMITWVDDGLAGKDYTHFNASGSRKVAKLIYDEILKGYNKYKEENQTVE